VSGLLDQPPPPALLAEAGAEGGGEHEHGDQASADELARAAVVIDVQPDRGCRADRRAQRRRGGQEPASPGSGARRRVRPVVLRRRG